MIGTTDTSEVPKVDANPNLAPTQPASKVDTLAKQRAQELLESPQFTTFVKKVQTLLEDPKTAKKLLDAPGQLTTLDRVQGYIQRYPTDLAPYIEDLFIISQNFIDRDKNIISPLTESMFSGIKTPSLQWQPMRDDIERITVPIDQWLTTVLHIIGQVFMAGQSAYLTELGIT